MKYLRQAPMYCLGCGTIKWRNQPATCPICGGAVFSSTPRLVPWEKQLSQQDRDFLKVQRIDYR